MRYFFIIEILELLASSFSCRNIFNPSKSSKGWWWQKQSTIKWNSVKILVETDETIYSWQTEYFSCNQSSYYESLIFTVILWRRSHIFFTVNCRVSRLLMLFKTAFTQAKQDATVLNYKIIISDTYKYW